VKINLALASITCNLYGCGAPLETPAGSIPVSDGEHRAGTGRYITIHGYNAS